jgi:hypothetical protein
MISITRRLLNQRTDECLVLRRQLAGSFDHPHPGSSSTAQAAQDSAEERKGATFSPSACQHSGSVSPEKPDASNRRAAIALEGLDSCSTQRMSRALRDEERLRRSMERQAQAAQRTEVHFEHVARETERLVKVVTQAVSALEGLAVDDQASPAAAENVAGRQRLERGELIQSMCQTLLASLQSMVRFPLLKLGGLDEVHDASEDDATPRAADAEQLSAEMTGVLQGGAGPGQVD